MTKNEKLIYDRSNHQYASPGREHPTPVSQIPPRFRKKVALPGTNRTQIVDSRLCYNWEPGANGGRFVECGSVAADADAGKF